MSASASRAAPDGGFASEVTDAGAQTLVPGITTIRLADRLTVLANAPLQSRRRQRPADDGLFDLNARNQLEMC